MAVIRNSNGEALREPVNARGHRVLAHLCTELEQRLLAFGCTNACARDLLEGMLRRAHLAAARDVQDLDAAERATAALLERVLAR